MKIYAINVRLGSERSSEEYITGYYLTKELAQKDLIMFATHIKKSVPNLIISEDLVGFTYTDDVVKITYELIEIDVIDS